jgi:hypothetical protein
MTQPFGIPLSQDKAKNAALGFAIGQTAYAMNNAGGLVVGQPLHYIDDFTVNSAPGASSLNLSIPAGYIVQGVYRDKNTGADVFLAYSDTDKKAVIGVAGSNGIPKDRNDTKSDIVNLGVDQTRAILSDREFSFAIESVRRMAGDDLQVVIGGQSLGGGVAKQLGIALVYGAPALTNNDVRSLNFGQPISGFGLNSDQVTVISVNGFGTELAFERMGLTSPAVQSFEQSSTVQNFFVQHATSGTMDAVTLMGGRSIGDFYALYANRTVSDSLGGLHRFNFGVAEGLTTLGYNFQSIMSVAAPTPLNHGSVTRNLWGIDGIIGVENNRVSLTASAYAALLLSVPGETTSSASSVLQKTFGLNSASADFIGGGIEIVARAFPFLNPAGAAKVLLGSLGVGKLLGSSPAPAFEVDWGEVPSGFTRSNGVVNGTPVVIDSKEGVAIVRFSDKTTQQLTAGVDGNPTQLVISRPDGSGAVRDIDAQGSPGAGTLHLQGGLFSVPLLAGQDLRVLSGGGFIVESTGPDNSVVLVSYVDNTIVTQSGSWQAGTGENKNAIFRTMGAPKVEVVTSTGALAKLAVALDANGTPVITGFADINGQALFNGSMLNTALGQLNFKLGNLEYGYQVPGELANLLAAGDPTNPTGLPTTPTTDNKPWYQSDGAQKLGGVLTSMQSLIASLKTGKPLAIATDTFNLAMSASHNPDLKDTGQYLNYANSLVNFAGAFERGDDLSAFISGASIVKQYMQSQASTALDVLTQAIGTAAGTGAVTQLQNASTKWNDTTKLQEEFAKNPALTQNPDAQSKLANYVDAKDLFQKLDVGLNILSVHNAFSTGGNEVGKVQAVAFLLAAMDAQWALWAGPVGWAMAGISIIGSLFGSEPDIWGTAYAVNDANGTTRAQILENHDDGGLHAVAALDNLIDQLEDNSVKDGLGLIAQRLPGVQVWYDGRPNVFTLWFEDAQTGVFTARGYDKDGKYLGELDAQSKLIAPDVNQASYFGNMGQHFATAADVASAVVPLWMQQTIDQQAALGLQYAGKSTELRAKEQGQLLATNPGNALPGNAGNLDDSSTQTARLITLDWDDNGSIAVATRAQGHGVLVDIDNDGSAEETDWIGTHDAILVLDHNGNGKVDNGHELFNDAQINTALRGLHALDEFDANGDGKITASDPVYNQLKVWLDIQHDGQMQAFETLSLAAANISELGINSGQFVRNGEADLMTTTALTADSAGTIVHVEGNNLRVLKETGDTLLMVSALADFAKSTDAQVRDSHTRLSANGSLTVVNELMDGLEDTAIVVSVEQLLKNDTSSAGTTSISMVGGAFGGTVSLDAAQGTIRFTPSAEFSGEGSFRYVVTDAQGQKTTGKALVHVAGVNDAPVLANLGATRAAGSADFKTTGSTITMPTGNVPKLESPARLELGVAQANLAGVTILGATDSQHLVGQKDGQMYVGTLQGNLQPAWQTARVRVGIFGAVAGTDVDSANALNYQKLLDGRYGTVEINANTGLWSYTQNSWPQYVTQDAFVVNAIDEHGGKAELKVVVQLDPLFDPLAPPVVYSDLRYDAAPPPTPVPAAVGAGDQVLHGDGGNNWIYGAAGNDKVYGAWRQ